MLFLPRYLAPGDTWLVVANILIGMLFMVMVHCIITATRAREKNYLLLGFFFIGALINSIGNVYVRFFVVTIEPYIGSWIMMGSFVLFIESYLALPFDPWRFRIGMGMLVMSGSLLVVSILHNLIYGRGDTTIIYAMDIVSAVFLLGLLGFLLAYALRGNRRGWYLFIFELTIVFGGIAALGITKAILVDSGVFPIEFFQSNLVFILGMTINGILFSSILGFDLTRLKVSAAVAEERNRELKELDHAKNELMMNVSHEFRTPITIISGIISQLKQGRWGDSISANKGNLEVIERNNLRLHKQVEGLLKLATMEKRRHSIVPASIDLSATLRSLVGEFLSLAELKGISLTAIVPDSLHVVADADLLRTATANLIGNALKFTPRGGVVELEADQTETAIRIAVRDTGPGIPEEEHERIFYRFHQLGTPAATHAGGTGIGLSLVKAVMERHNGRVELTSAPGAGSTFTLVFPHGTESTVPIGDAFGSTGLDLLIEGHRAEIIGGMDSENYVERPDTPEVDGSTPLVLIVEDDRELRDFLDTELGAHFSVVLARHGFDALERMKEQPPDLVVSDVMMPEMDGYELLSAMQEDERLRLIPTIFLTARDAENDRISALAEGVVDYIAKPFSMDALVARVRNVIETNAAFKNRYQQYVKRSIVSFLEDLPTAEDTEHRHERRFRDFCRDARLTERELEVALLVREGLSDKEVAAELGLSTKTVGNHNSSIFRKCGFTGRVDLVVWGRGTVSG